MFNDLKAALSGRKTFITGIAMVVVALLSMIELGLGVDIPSFTAAEDPFQLAMNGLGFIFVRAGINKIGDP